MTESDVRRYILTEKARARSNEEQANISKAMWEHGIGPQSEGLKRKEIKVKLGLDLDYDPRTSLNHLVDIDLVEEYKRPGPDTYVIAEWREEDPFIMGEVSEAAESAIENLIAHIHEDDPMEGDDSTAIADGAGATIRSAVAGAFDYDPPAVEECLRSGDPVDKLNMAVDAIEENDDLEVRDDYGHVVFINPAYRYRLTKKAVHLYTMEGE